MVHSSSYFGILAALLLSGTPNFNLGVPPVRGGTDADGVYTYTRRLLGPGCAYSSMTMSAPSRRRGWGGEHACRAASAPTMSCGHTYDELPPADDDCGGPVPYCCHTEEPAAGGPSGATRLANPSACLVGDVTPPPMPATAASPLLRGGGGPGGGGGGGPGGGGACILSQQRWTSLEYAEQRGKVE